MLKSFKMPSTGQEYLTNMFSYSIQIRVRYADTDQMGYVYYGNYARYYEIARVESLRHLGLTYNEIEKSGVMMPVLENKSKYLRPALYDELLTIRLFIRDLPAKRVTFEYEIYNEQEKLINLGETTLAFIHADSRKPCQAPDVIVNAYKPFFENAKSN